MQQECKRRSEHKDKRSCKMRDTCERQLLSVLMKKKTLERIEDKQTHDSLRIGQLRQKATDETRRGTMGTSDKGDKTKIHDRNSRKPAKGIQSSEELRM